MFPEDAPPPSGDARAQRLEALAADMEASGRGRDDPVRTVFALVGDRWTMLLLLVLGTGDWRHAELRRVVGRLSIEEGISQRVLTEKLRALRRNGFVSRHSTDDVPPRVTYRLTKSGCELLDRARALLDWVKGEVPVILAARDGFACEAD